jgi:hypothetical protein
MDPIPQSLVAFVDFFKSVEGVCSIPIVKEALGCAKILLTAILVRSPYSPAKANC